jgi:hypothetical protein
MKKVSGLRFIVSGCVENEKLKSKNVKKVSFVTYEVPGQAPDDSLKLRPAIHQSLPLKPIINNL